jgi:sulfate/thiosulfate transport system substrate-binding protein
MSRRDSTLPRFSSTTKRSLAVAGTAAVTALAIAACGGSSDSTGATGTSTGANANAKTQLNLVGYSTPEKAFGALTSAFEKTPAGKGVGFSSSFGSSGSQSKAVAAGQAADVVSFSTTPDMTRLVQGGLVAKNWNANPEQGFSSDSVVVFVVRKGNPDHITTWNDLIKKGVTVVTPNPATSGSARWNILAGYGAVLKQGGTPAEALAYTKTLITKNVTEEDPSASEALSTFTSGKGDVLLDYESDAIAAERAGDKISYVIPKQTILIQTPIAVLSKSSHKSQADAFLKYQWSTAGQTVWAQQGYRPVLASVAAKFKSQFPTPPQLFNISYLGGWNKASELFAPSTGAITKIEQEGGFPTASS